MKKEWLNKDALNKIINNGNNVYNVLIYLQILKFYTVKKTMHKLPLIKFVF